MKKLFIVVFYLFIATEFTCAQKNIKKTKIKSFKKISKGKHTSKTVTLANTQCKDTSEIITKPSLKINSQPANGEIIVGTDTSGRTIYQGPDQRKYYYNDKGQKVYMKE